ncbi:hypothetical protein BDV96DRAFT_309347 [Lophiotrema nucula]|uniref:BTB domain-containing protein n=1 Tax=Lophiotrema nucula TaxID=690887 RepID=A0A6A5YJF1_9PLEO|nr:hypothetical protein BDV96DRAFT_309347 [Lophiotrema nucula]
MAEASREHLLAAVKGALSSGDFHDLVVTCGQDVYKVHKVIVCPRSEFFGRAVRFKASKEAEDGKIDLPEDEPEIIKLLMQYFYEAEYESLLPTVTQVNLSPPKSPFPHTCRRGGPFGANFIKCEIRHPCQHHRCGLHCNWDCFGFVCRQYHPSSNAGPTNTANGGCAEQLLLHAKMYAVADKYQVVGLKDLAKEKFERACKQFWNSEDHFITAAEHVFSSTPDSDKGLRDIITSTLASHPELIDIPGIDVLMSKDNGLAYGLVKKKRKLGWH